MENMDTGEGNREASKMASGEAGLLEFRLCSVTPYICSYPCTLNSIPKVSDFIFAGIANQHIFGDFV